MNRPTVRQHRELLRLLDWATTYVELDTRNGARTNPADWPRLHNGDPDAEAIARACRDAINAIRGPGRDERPPIR